MGCVTTTHLSFVMLSGHPSRSRLTIKQCTHFSRQLSRHRCHKYVKAPRSWNNRFAFNYSSSMSHVRFGSYDVHKNSFSTSIPEFERGTCRLGMHFSSTGLPVILLGSNQSCVGIRLLMTSLFNHEKNLTCVQRRKYSMTRGKASYYDVLGLAPQSTQAQIKNAFFKLSKLYHPDVNHSKEAVSKFRAILEAYEVLGNVRKRRLYDEGISNPDEPINEHTVSNNYTNGFRSGEKFGRRRQQAPPTGRSNIYNFDEFYKQHYGESIRRDRANKDRMEQMKKEHENYHKSAGDTLNGIVFATVFMAAIALVLELADRYHEYELEQKQRSKFKEKSKE